MQTHVFVDTAKEHGHLSGWRHENRTILQAQGAGSGGFPPMFKAQIVPSMGDLAARLEQPGARFLDVGVGVARLSISMCRVYPELHVVGLDPYEVPLKLARENVQREGLDQRIELRAVGIEELREEAAFDLAWVPVIFFPEEIVPRALSRVRTSLRPGGWILFPTIGAVGDDLQRSVWALQNELWGGPVLGPDDAERLLADAKFSSIRTIVGPPWSPVLTVAQRP
jgi:2-polyprenyl-3-methyl-5-hydroxy-6-metoxy-1,4-benzoquinol methylase